MRPVCAEIDQPGRADQDQRRSQPARLGGERALPAVQLALDRRFAGEGVPDVEPETAQAEHALAPRHPAAPQHERQKERRADQERQIDLDQVVFDPQPAADDRGDTEDQQPDPLGSGREPVRGFEQNREADQQDAGPDEERRQGQAADDGPPSVGGGRATQL